MVVQKFCDFNVVGVAYFVGLFVVECHGFPVFGCGFRLSGLFSLCFGGVRGLLLIGAL